MSINSISSWKSGDNYDEIEQSLASSRIISMSPISVKLSKVPWAKGYNSIYHVHLSCGTEGVFRPYSEKQNSKYFDSTIFAYTISKNLGFNVVPPAVQSAINVKGDNPTMGSFQLFISPDVWSVEHQKYSNFINNVSQNEQEKVEAFQYLTGLCDRHKGNRIIDHNGYVAVIDVGDICTPKMIIPGQWEFILIGSLSQSVQIKGALDFENQRIDKINNPSSDDLHILFKPFVPKDRLTFYVNIWVDRLCLNSKESQSVEFIFWRKSLWVKHSRKTYTPLKNIIISDLIENKIRNVTLVDLVKWSQNESALLTIETIFYRVSKLKRKLINRKTNDNLNNFPMADILAVISEQKEDKNALKKKITDLKYKSKVDKINFQAELEDLKQKHFDKKAVIKASNEKLLKLKSQLEKQSLALDSMSKGFQQAQTKILSLKNDIHDLNSTINFPARINRAKREGLSSHKYWLSVFKKLLRSLIINLRP